MKKVRYGFKPDKDRLDHLKLCQVKRYLKAIFIPVHKILSGHTGNQPIV
ncbi:MAG: hypothetical protein NC904_05770 [Candidatus Omnitrophica bacterium]|nr:hypothetical protein [Candidatus Omnitrophota bacterium]